MLKFVNIEKKNNYEKIDLSSKSWLIIIKNWFTLNDNQFKELWKFRPIERQKIKIFNKLIDIPRRNSLYSDNSDIKYKFSGTVTESQPISNIPILEELLEKINNTDLSKKKLNAIFINWYKDGTEYIGPHSDDEKNLDIDVGIWSLSFGEIRTFRITDKFNNNKIKDIDLENGILIGMCGDFQKEFKHALLKSKKKNGKRINLTFRKFK